MTSESASRLAALTGEVPVQRSRLIWTRVGKIAFLVVAAVLAACVAISVFLVWTVQRSFPQTTGELHLEGLDGRGGHAERDGDEHSDAWFHGGVFG